VRLVSWRAVARVGVVRRRKREARRVRRSGERILE